ncbi:MAG: DUF1080 domain-containing protein [Fibrella sp.]|nr:DUF1080 domain-containing protein [Armatimonadota bacterium]
MTQSKQPAIRFLLLFLLSLALVAPVRAGSPDRDGFVSLFDGKTLDGWVLVGGVGSGYVVRDGVLTLPPDSSGNLFTEKEYSDFHFRFEFRLSAGANSGIGLRAPLDGDSAYVGMESQILDDTSPEYADLEAAQYHGSLYTISAAKRGALKPVGEWNREEIRVVGRTVRVTLNGKTIVDTDLNKITDPKILLAHPGMLRDQGRIGLLGHNRLVEFRNLSVKDLSKAQPANQPPPGFVALFNGQNLDGWKALVTDPPTRAKTPPEELAEAQRKADREVQQHWQVQDGILAYDGKNNNLCTSRDYGDFELLVDWKIPAGGDSGIYLRGSPQVQIWDDPVGSGGIYNNQKNPSRPIKRADHPPGTWNRFRILLLGDHVTVFLNDELVVNNVLMENYWARGLPLYPQGAIELQHHQSPLYFKNIFVRALSRSSPDKTL